MQTNFSLAQLSDVGTAEADKILRSCVHCGFCTATCPTFMLLGDELDSPRGRIYLIKEMFEADRAADAETVRHIDRCLSCLGCMTTCPSGVNYMHLVDAARARIEKTYRRPFAERLMRASLAFILPHPRRFALALRAGVLAKPLAPMLAGFGKTGQRLAAMLRLAPNRLDRALRRRSKTATKTNTPQIARVALLKGCAQSVLRPQTNASAIDLLERLGVEIAATPGEVCCGALVHHLGDEAQALSQARRNIDLWSAQIESRGLDAILVTASGCGTMIKDYGFLLRNEASYAAKAARISALAKDATEFLATLDLGAPRSLPALTVAYQSACSMQHGQKIDALPKRLLAQAGFLVRDLAEAHLCCGSAGTYNILQPELAAALRDRKVANILATSPDVVATGNIGCVTQIASAIDIPMVHTIELLAFAYGGPRPPGLD
ncbi:heterodisulfide reductase-related iron-sulfur binding cluster [Methylocapsa acidiphila]|uniref:heterodisulfide reductase-related iron-sulfur binding cluster n=1 Tax=Methylocapsa acidiphila TaxID=133552 RepID=UPI00042218A9|nr:heterodisulfide reductase-related iron-sulfur binding cluster [Methylocapsa acidiphila]